MTARWVKYVPNAEQIKRLKAAIKSGNGVLIKNKYGDCKIVTSQLHAYEFTEYLICNPHPLSDMICQWARTGQPVWVRVTGTMPAGVLKSGETVDVKVAIDPSNTSYTFSIAAPNWNIPGAEYSLTPFEG